MTQAETAVTELNKPFCELQLQYCCCQRRRVLCTGLRDRKDLIKAILIGTLNHQFGGYFSFNVLQPSKLTNNLSAGK